MHQATYHEVDIAQLVHNIPLVRLGGNGIARVLRLNLAEVDNYAHLLPLYPHAEFEPLAMVYQLRRALDVFDTKLLEDMLAISTPKIHTLGLLLEALSGNPINALRIETLKTCFIGDTQLKHIILAHYGDTLPAELVSAEEQLRKLKTYLEALPVGITTLRPALRGDYLAKYQVLAAQVATAYKANQADMVVKLLKEPLLRYYLQSYRDWVRSGSLPPP